ncbi:Dimethylallyltranstransferase [Dactylellina cionopaga]|nr:Dimethylallyltranstransferase [Dactylellina cionopaga]
MLDDMEDNSPLRRGQDAAHVVYGQAQAINSSNYLIVWAIEEVNKLGNPIFMNILFDELKNSFIGQSFEMKYRDERVCPTEEQYIDMVEKKTGGLFRFLARLTQSMGTINKHINLDHFAYILGQYFQIRDDYMNLTDTAYTDLKGFCEDLDEGKFSYLIVHAWNSQSEDSNRLQELFEKRSKTNSMMREEKEEVLSILRKCGSFEYTEKKMNSLHKEIADEIREFEQVVGQQNWSLRYILHNLKVNSNV